MHKRMFAIGIAGSIGAFGLMAGTAQAAPHHHHHKHYRAVTTTGAVVTPDYMTARYPITVSQQVTPTVAPAPASTVIALVTHATPGSVVAVDPPVTVTVAPPPVPSLPAVAPPTPQPASCLTAMVAAIPLATRPPQLQVPCTGNTLGTAPPTTQTTTTAVESCEVRVTHSTTGTVTGNSTSTTHSVKFAETCATAYAQWGTDPTAQIVPFYTVATVTS